MGAHLETAAVWGFLRFWATVPLDASSGQEEQGNHRSHEESSRSVAMHRVHKIKLDPTQEQAIYFAMACGVARFAFNWALAAWKEEYEAGGKPNEAALRKRLNAIKGSIYV